jgi:hypothetical protein
MPFDPDVVFSMFGMFLGMFGIQPKGDDVHICGSPLYHTAVLMFAAARCTSGTPSSSWTSGRPKACSSSSRSTA